MISELQVPVKPKHTIWSLPVSYIFPQAKSTELSCSEEVEHAGFFFQASQLKTSSLAAYFSPSFTSRSIYKFLNLQNPGLVKKQSSNKNVLAQIHFTYL